MTNDPKASTQPPKGQQAWQKQGQAGSGAQADGGQNSPDKPAGQGQQTWQKKGRGGPRQQGGGMTPSGGGQNPPNKPAGQGQQTWQQGGAPNIVQVQPLARKAGMRRRHWGLVLGFLFCVLLPLGAFGWYLWTQAEDRYGSTTAFSVRSEEGGGASELIGGLAQFAGAGSIGVDSDILFEFIQSQEIVETVNAQLDLRAHYTAPWPKDWMFSIWPEATLEDLIWYWQRVVRISYDQSTGLIELRVLAYDPQMAQQMAQAIVRASEGRINALSEQAREDAMGYARIDLDEAVTELKRAREALTEFRTRTRIVDPEADIQGRMGVMNNLQQALAEALIEHDLLRDTVSPADPRVRTAQRRIDVIRARIAAERTNFATDSTELGAVGEDYPSLIAEFESLSVDREFAEQSYRAALTALDLARDNAARQSRYLATYIKPTLAQSSEFPRRYVLMGLAALFLLMFWSILALIYYSIRDRG